MEEQSDGHHEKQKHGIKYGVWEWNNINININI